MSEPVDEELASPGNAWFAIVGALTLFAGLLSVTVLATVPPPSDLSCFDDRPKAMGATLPERLALADAHARQASECAGPWRQCDLWVRATQDEIAVYVERADAQQGGCTYMPGDGELLIYDRNGIYLETGISL